MKQTRVYQEALEEGRQEGRRQEGVALILRLLARRVGDLPESTLTQVTRLSLPQLENLGEALLEFSTLSDLENWLAQQPD